MSQTVDDLAPHPTTTTLSPNYPPTQKSQNNSTMQNHSIRSNPAVRNPFPIIAHAKKSIPREIPIRNGPAAPNRIWSKTPPRVTPLVNNHAKDALTRETSAKQL